MAIQEKCPMSPWEREFKERQMAAPKSRMMEKRQAELLMKYFVKKVGPHSYQLVGGVYAK